MLGDSHLINAIYCTNRASALVDQNNLQGALCQLTNAVNHLLLHLGEHHERKEQDRAIPPEDGDVQVS